MNTPNLDDLLSQTISATTSGAIDAKTVIIRRKLEQDQASLVIKCPPGRITILHDSDTGCLLPYQQALAGLEQPDFSLSLGLNDYNHRLCALAGFGDRLPDESILAYLTRAGQTPEQVELSVRRYEFAQYKFLTCAQLSQTAARQVSLLAACSGPKNFLILNDPFQPFSGRWREHFAELLLQEAKEKDRTIVIVNLSFMPQVWNDERSINLINVSKSCERAAQLAKEKRVREERLREQMRIEAEKAKVAAEKEQNRTISFETSDGKQAQILDPIYSAYSVTRDFIFAPFAAISSVLRFFSGPALTFSIGIFLLIGALVMFPDIRHKWLALDSLSSKLDLGKGLSAALSEQASDKANKKAGQVARAPIDRPSVEQVARNEADLVVTRTNIQFEQVTTNAAQTKPGEQKVSVQAAHLLPARSLNVSYLIAKLDRLVRIDTARAKRIQAQIAQKVAKAQAS